MKVKARSMLWITDPWRTLDHERDTTIRLMQAALAKRIPIYWADVSSIEVAERITLDAREVLSIGVSRSSSQIQMTAPAKVDPAVFRQVHFRTDPPIDLHYLHPLQILELAGARILNPSRALFALNEKIAASAAQGPAPRSLVSSQEGALLSFLAKEGRAVLKPLHEAQSKGIHLLEASQLQTARLRLQEASVGFSRPVLLQQYLPGISQGETRLWFVDSKLLACARKLPLEGDFRVQIDRGSRVVPTTLSSAERKASVWCAKLLKKWKVRLAAVDLIEGLVTDFNVTSPGLIVQMESALGKDLATPIIRALSRD